MQELSMDYRCTHCGHSQTYRLVPEVAPDPSASLGPREITSLDLRCLRCGAGQTYTLVPEAVKAA